MPSPRLPANLAAFALAAACTSASGQTVWQCWLDDQSVACSLMSDRAGAIELVRAALPPMSMPAGTLLADTRPLMQVLRQQPGLLRGKVMRIPLHTVPFDNSAVAELAQAVMCGSRNDCSARYAAHPADTPETAAGFADANDPLLLGGE